MSRWRLILLFVFCGVCARAEAVEAFVASVSNCRLIAMLSCSEVHALVRLWRRDIHPHTFSTGEEVLSGLYATIKTCLSAVQHDAQTDTAFNLRFQCCVCLQVQQQRHPDQVGDRQGLPGTQLTRSLHSEVDAKALAKDAPVEDASHQQAMQHGKGGVEPEHKLQRQLGQRFTNLPDAVTLSAADSNTASGDALHNVTSEAGGSASLNTDITPGECCVEAPCIDAVHACDHKSCHSLHFSHYAA